MRKDSISKRLLQYFEETRQIHHQTMQLVDSDLATAGVSLDKLYDFENDKIHAAASRIALNLDSANKDDALMLSAFEMAGLNHRNPAHWRSLLSIFCKVFFENEKEGRPLEWGPGEYMNLLIDFHQVKKKAVSKLSASRVCTLLRTRVPFKKKYGRFTNDALRKLVKRARDPQNNVLLQHPEMGDPLLQLLRHGDERKGIEWTAEREAFLKMMIERIIPMLEAADAGK